MSRNMDREVQALADVINALDLELHEYEVTDLARHMYDCGVRAPEPTCGARWGNDAGDRPCSGPPGHAGWHASAPYVDGMTYDGHPILHGGAAWG